MNLQKLKDYQRGDTIVEVLLAIVVVSAVLVGAFAVSNKSSRAVRMAQERSEGTKYAAGAVEIIRDKSEAFKGADPKFCIDGSDATIAKPCPEPLSNGVQYYTVVNKLVTAFPPPGVDPPLTYEVTTSWDGLNGKTESVVLLYRSGQNE